MTQEEIRAHFERLAATMPDDIPVGLMAQGSSAELLYAQDLKRQGKKWADREDEIPDEFFFMAHLSYPSGDE